MNWTVAHKASLAMYFSRQEYWNGLPFPSPGDLPNPRIKPRYPAFQADSLPSEPPGRLRIYISIFMNIYSPSSEKTMAPHSSTLAWKIPWMEEPGGLQSMGSRRVRQDWKTSLSLFTFMHWRRKWQPTPVFFPGESQGRGSLVGCHLWSRTESDTTEGTYQQ